MCVCVPFYPMPISHITVIVHPCVRIMTPGCTPPTLTHGYLPHNVATRCSIFSSLKRSGTDHNRVSTSVVKRLLNYSPLCLSSSPSALFLPSPRQYNTVSHCRICATGVCACLGTASPLSFCDYVRCVDASIDGWGKREEMDEIGE